jgi:hypothetical protein
MTSALPFTNCYVQLLLDFANFSLLPPLCVLCLFSIIQLLTAHCPYSNTYIAITAATFGNGEELY